MSYKKSKPNLHAIRLRERRQKLRARTDDEILAKQKQIYGNNPDTALKLCTICGKRQVLQHFSKQRSNLDGLGSNCRKCVHDKNIALTKKLQKRTDAKIREIQIEKYTKKTGELLKHCIKCKQDRHLNNFHKRSIQEDGLDRYCKTCSNDFSRSVLANASKLRHELKKDAQCAICGLKDPEVLHFAHLNREEKYQNRNGKRICISEMRSLKTIQNEAKKTRFLCAFCHRLDTQKEDEILHQQTTREPTSRWKSNKKFVDQVKLTIQKCTDCQRLVTENTCRGFDFDHVDEETKEAIISHLVVVADIETIKKEIDKCELRCANCHMKRTNKRRNEKTIASILDQMITKIETDQANDVAKMDCF